MLRCPRCRAEVPSVLQLCAYCGYEWPQGREPAHCPVCGRPP
ncbi:MAG: zinc ribbon domain-containing protein, partial [Bacillota bacterium]